MNLSLYKNVVWQSTFNMSSNLYCIANRILNIQLYSLQILLTKLYIFISLKFLLIKNWILAYYTFWCTNSFVTFSVKCFWTVILWKLFTETTLQYIVILIFDIVEIVEFYNWHNLLTLARYSLKILTFAKRSESSRSNT